jgi:hypothetical protein
LTSSVEEDDQCAQIAPTPGRNCEQRRHRRTQPAVEQTDQQRALPSGPRGRSTLKSNTAEVGDGSMPAPAGTKRVRVGRHANLRPISAQLTFSQGVQIHRPFSKPRLSLHVSITLFIVTNASYQSTAPKPYLSIPQTVPKMPLPTIPIAGKFSSAALMARTYPPGSRKCSSNSTTPMRTAYA